ncbi:MAG: TetR/AcrR family transcriptional regulator [Lachnospiraceae bacterium]|nr:TetR/AcrR family transcriptional regulator [Lachnospiraceae bacterium]
MPDRVFTDEQRDELRTIMLEAGFPLIREYGVTHTTISKITAAAGIAKGTFYHFWKNKEEYLAELIRYHRKKMLPQLIGEDVLMGKRKLGKEDTRIYFRHLVDKEKSIYANMTLEDEAKLMQKTSDFAPDEEKESSIAVHLLGMLDDVRPDVDLLLLANMTKILVLTAEAKDELHESAYEKTIDTIIDGILNLIFQKGCVKND